jgi:hypothetical protein
LLGPRHTVRDDDRLMMTSNDRYDGRSARVTDSACSFIYACACACAMSVSPHLSVISARHLSVICCYDARLHDITIVVSCRVDLQAVGLLLMWMTILSRAPPMIILMSDRCVSCFAP